MLAKENYSRVLNKIGENDYQVFDNRIYLNTAEKLSIIPKGGFAKPGILVAFNARAKIKPQHNRPGRGFHFCDKAEGGKITLIFFITDRFVGTGCEAILQSLPKVVLQL